MTHLLLILLLAQLPERTITVEVRPSRPVQGQLVLVEVTGGKPGDRVAGTFGERKLRFFIDAKRRVRALTAAPLSQRTDVILTVQVTPPDSDPVIHGVPVGIQEGTFDKQELEVDPKYVKPPKDVLPRIKREGREMRRLWRKKATPRRWRGNFVWPRKDELCSSFGLKRMFNGKLKSRHFGVDIDGKTGEPLVAIGAGTVVMVSDRYYSGGTVVIDHGLKLFSMYFHMSEYAVKPGDRVERGQLIGKVGKSGRVTGPHVHLGTKIEGLAFDPLSLLDFDFGEEGR